MAGRPHQARRGVRGRENKRDTTDRERWPGPKGEHRKKKRLNYTGIRLGKEKQNPSSWKGQV